MIDEQHRFGVHQRLALGDKAPHSDVLVMTATPIPRTLVMTYYGDMDVSQLPDKPVGRKPIATSALPLERLGELVSRMEKAVSEGQKIYWVCPLVEESDEVQATSAEQRFAHLQKHFGDKVGLVHGRMTSQEKEAPMVAFRSGKPAFWSRPPSSRLVLMCPMPRLSSSNMPSALAWPRCTSCAAALAAPTSRPTASCFTRHRWAK